MDLLKCAKSVYKLYEYYNSNSDNINELELLLTNLTENMEKLNTNFVDFTKLLSIKLNQKLPNSFEHNDILFFYDRCITLLQRKKKLKKLMK